MVRVEGLEPPRLAAPEPKSGASTNFATPAHAVTCLKAIELRRHTRTEIGRRGEKFTIGVYDHVPFRVPLDAKSAP